MWCDRTHGDVAFGGGRRWGEAMGSDNQANNAEGAAAGALTEAGEKAWDAWDAREARVFGCLVEKRFTTPEVYPMTLNELVNACNQKNNRAPVVSWTEDEVTAGLDGLRARRLVSHFAGAVARVAKYRLTLDNELPLGEVELAWLAELLLRGPQTTAGLRGNAERMRPMPDLAEVETGLEELAARRSGALVVKLPRQPGQKEARWGQVLTGTPRVEASAESATGRGLAAGMSSRRWDEMEGRVAALEAEVAELRTELTRLRAALGE